MQSGLFTAEDIGMDFTIRIDDEAEAYIPSVKQGKVAVTLGESHLAVHLGALFDLSVDVAAIAGACEMENPEPQVYLPLGISMAAEQLGRDTIAAVTSQDGLVMIDFAQPVEARKGPPAQDSDSDDSDTDESDAGSTGTMLTLQHLILSLQEPAEFVNALQHRIGGAAAVDAG
jgi:hypothetical protein